jgi:hypothetical protein
MIELRHERAWQGGGIAYSARLLCRTRLELRTPNSERSERVLSVKLLELPIYVWQMLT